MKNQEFYDKPKIGVIILSFNNFIDTYECVQSIIDSKTNLSIEICVIDNSPNDLHFKNLKEKIDNSNVTFIKETKNLGYSHGNNVGLRYFFEKGINLYLILNNDTIVTDFFADNLFEKWKTNRGVIAPLIYEYSNKSKIWSYGGFFDFFTANYKMFTTISLEEKISFLPGCCIFFSREIIDKIGFLAEDYFMYCEDAEYSFKAIKNNFQLIVEKKSVIFHKVSKSSVPNSPFHLYYLFKSRIIFINRNFKSFQKFYSYFVTFLQIFYYMLKFFFIDFSVTKALFYSFIDRKKLGKQRY